MQKTTHGMQHATLKSKPLQFILHTNCYGKERQKTFFMDKKKENVVW